MTGSKEEIESKVKRLIRERLKDKEVEEKILAEIDKDIEELIAHEVKETIEKEFGIKPAASEMAEEEIEIEPTAPEPTEEEIEEKPASKPTLWERFHFRKKTSGTKESQIEESPDDFKRPLLGFRRYFYFCWKGVCRPISWVMIVAYVTVAVLILICPIFGFSQICLNRGLLGAAPYLGWVALIAFLISIVLSFLSAYSRTALVFSAFLSIPLIIIVFISFIEYIGLILIALVLINLIIQGRGSEY